MVEYCDTPETERREQTGNTKHTYTLEASSLLDWEPHQECQEHLASGLEVLYRELLEPTHGRR
jgi:hypothetical protein